MGVSVTKVHHRKNAGIGSSFRRNRSITAPQAAMSTVIPIIAVPAHGRESFTSASLRLDMSGVNADGSIR